MRILTIEEIEQMAQYLRSTNERENIKRRTLRFEGESVWTGLLQFDQELGWLLRKGSRNSTTECKIKSNELISTIGLLFLRHLEDEPVVRSPSEKEVGLAIGLLDSEKGINDHIRNKLGEMTAEEIIKFSQKHTESLTKFFYIEELEEKLRMMIYKITTELA